MQRAAAQAADLEILDQLLAFRRVALVHRRVKSDQAVAVRRLAPRAHCLLPFPDAPARSAMDEHPASQVIDNAINRRAVFQQGQRDGTVADAIDVVVRAIDRVEHPTEPGGHWGDGALRGQFLAEKLVRGKPAGDGRLDMLRDGNVHGGHLGAVMFDLAAGSAEFPVHKPGFGHDGQLGGGDALFDFGQIHLTTKPRSTRRTKDRFSAACFAITPAPALVDARGGRCPSSRVRSVGPARPPAGASSHPSGRTSRTGFLSPPRWKSGH